jgi:hypothetical protein
MSIVATPIVSLRIVYTLRVFASTVSRPLMSTSIVSTPKVSLRIVHTPIVSGVCVYNVNIYSVF